MGIKTVFLRCDLYKHVVLFAVFMSGNVNGSANFQFC